MTCALRKEHVARKLIDDFFRFRFLDVGADEHITLDLRYQCPTSINCFLVNVYYRGTRFVLSRDELLTLPEFVLLSLFPNGLLPDGHMNSFHEGDIYPVDVCHSSPIFT